ncbi:hypothetical protein DBR32_12465 [Taibaiella sp. KBW10]|uniref:bestrophin family protein n=1 Tax=Taibaiella sp. KBW10 TaxID=2153357 RepID=UPI000F5B70F0|nr:bestrophin family ion channel [Taibaiella sp. KBW10]RQO30376.1 hypothetical protein DBR32_12465 [Taibaiella sp. KBW10]
MLVNKSLTFRGIMAFSGHHLIWLSAWMLLIAALYHFTHWRWLSIPWLPVSLIGTAVAFYVGFKNNQAYDRLWEGRKIWGGIVNSSRAWGTIVLIFIRSKNIPDKEVTALQQQLIYRHIYWLYTLRNQLLQPTPWEHVSLSFIGIGRYNEKRSKKFGLGLYAAEDAEKHWRKYLELEEEQELKNKANPATHLMHHQAKQISALEREDLIDNIKFSDMQKVLSDFFDHQGKLERIKKFPLPRQYGGLSFIFVCIFIVMLPFGIVAEFAKIGDIGIWLSVPFGVIIGWVYVNMELVGDYSENPFEGLFNDVPMLSLCRTIEIDLLQMLEETDIPKPVAAKNGVLM